MNDTTHSSVKISASVADIMAVIADVASYPEWVSGLNSVEILSSNPDGRPASAKFSGSMGMIADTYSLGYDWAEDGVSWHMLEGEKLTSLTGSYHCTPLGESHTEVEYQLNVGLAIPVVGMLRRRGEKMIVESALKGLKKRVER